MGPYFQTTKQLDLYTLKIQFSSEEEWGELCTAGLIPSAMTRDLWKGAIRSVTLNPDTFKWWIKQE
jgi:hypothetical protein